MSSTKTVVIKLLLFLNALVLIKANEILYVNTTHGKLYGKWMKSREGKNFVAFLGIPYAAPPVGPNRFVPPRPVQHWEGLRNATEEGNICIQKMENGDEDCLYLNVFTHQSKNVQHPVMVYIHGGGFYGGSSSLDMYGPEYFMDKNITLVTIQYRLGVFGFLSTEDQVVPGNMGLKDQVKALHWVQENIRNFGGDPSNVTIFGNSAGSVSVHLHLFSSQSVDLFARAISQSGTAFSAFSMVGKGSSKKITARLAKSLNCPCNSSEEIIRCLRNKNALNIQHEYSSMQDANYEIRKVLFRPVVEEPSEDAFLTSNPSQLNTQKPWLIGINANEGLFKINSKLLNQTLALIENEFSKFGPAIMFFEDFTSKPEEVADQIYNFYFKNTTTTKEKTISLEQVLSDSWFIWPTMRAIHQHEGPLFCYLFNHSGEHSFTQVRGGPKGGVSHMDELHYLFSQKKIFPEIMNQKDTNISKLLISLWTNFAERGSPTPSPISSNPQNETNEPVVWRKCNKRDKIFFFIQTEKLSNKSSVFSKRMDFWMNLQAKYFN